MDLNTREVIRAINNVAKKNRDNEESGENNDYFLYKFNEDTAEMTKVDSVEPIDTELLFLGFNLNLFENCIEYDGTGSVLDIWDPESDVFVKCLGIDAFEAVLEQESRSSNFTIFSINAITTSFYNVSVDSIPENSVIYYSRYIWYLVLNNMAFRVEDVY